MKVTVDSIDLNWLIQTFCMQKNTILSMLNISIALSNDLFVSKTSELKTTLHKYRYQGRGICLAFA